MADPVCIVVEMIRLVLPLIREQDEISTRQALSRITRLLTEIREGKASEGHYRALLNLAENLEGEARDRVGTPLLSSLKEREEEVMTHIRDRRCLVGTCLRHQPAPCQAACPAHIDIPTFMALIGHGRYDEATEVILRDMPFPWTCGLICPHPCEDACVRAEMDEPISIQLMKSYTAKMSMGNGGYRKPPAAAERPERVAVIGAGPSGLSAAYFLSLKGYRVSVFEKLPCAGGMLRFGIPAYRLPKDILDGEIEAIKELGIEIRTGVAFGRDITFDSLRKEGYRAFYVATGLSLSRRLNVTGEDQEGVLAGIDFLRLSALGTPPRLGNRVVVIGGGNVAVDVARTARRLGGGEVTMVCLESAEEMPAWKHEIHDAREEGIRIENSWGPRNLMGENGRFKAVEFMRCTSVFDENGRFNPSYDDCQLTVLEADNVILAIGQAADSSSANSENMDLGPGGTIKADLVTGETNLPGVFAGGDGVYGPRIAIDAIAAGKRAAVSIDCYLRGEKIPEPPYRPEPRGDVSFISLRASEKANLKRSKSVTLPLAERGLDFRQVEVGLTDEAAANEAKRCLRCDRCRGDGLCQYVCTEVGAEALRLTSTKSDDRLAYFDFANTHEKCIGCGSCAVACPHGNIAVVDKDGIRAISFCGTTHTELPVETCSGCGNTFVSHKHLQLIQERADQALGVEIDRTLCPECVRRAKAEEMTGLWAEV